MSYESLTYPERIASIAIVIASTATLEEQTNSLMPSDNLAILYKLQTRLSLLQQMQINDKNTEDYDDLRGQLLIEIAAISAIALDRIAMGCY